MIEHFRLFLAVCQGAGLTHGFSVFADISLYHIHLAAGEWRNDICPFLILFHFPPFPPTAQPLSSQIKMFLRD